MSQHTRIPVGEDYAVVIGRGVLDDPEEVSRFVPAGAERALIVTAPAMAARARALAATLTAAGLQVSIHQAADAERAKSLDELAAIWRVLGQEKFTRTDLVIGLGGGATTDLAGFAAATWLRGIAVLQIPTTVAGMVDAAVGGKTGINTEVGKNLVGSFHPPVGVLCDLDLLASLPRADIAAGLAEVVKGGFIADPQILRLIEADPETALDPTTDVFRELVERKVAVKATVVAADLKESSLREILNYGHTFGHAIENVEGYTWRHGDAVAVGLVYAAELAHAAGLIDNELVARHRAILTSLGLPISYAGGQWPDLLAAMQRDKKSRGSLLRFVVLDGSPGRVTRLEGPTEGELLAAYERVTAVEGASS